LADLMLSSVTGWRTLAMGILLVAWSPGRGPGRGTPSTRPVSGAPASVGRPLRHTTIPWLPGGSNGFDAAVADIRLQDAREPRATLQRRHSCGLAENGPFPATTAPCTGCDLSQGVRDARCASAHGVVVSTIPHAAGADTSYFGQVAGVMAGGLVRWW
jgi:hypothetical protein